jgi:hypothetical protein
VTEEKKVSRLRIGLADVRIWLFGPRKASLFSRLVILAFAVLLVVLTVRSVTESGRTKRYVNQVVPPAISASNKSFCTSFNAQLANSNAYAQIFQLLITALGTPSTVRTPAQQEANQAFINVARNALDDTHQTAKALADLSKQLHCPPPPPKAVKLPPVPKVSPS